MAHRIPRILTSLILLCAAMLPLTMGTQAATARDSGPAGSCIGQTYHPSKFTFGETEVLVCASTVQSGAQLHLVVHTRKASLVHIQLLFPDGTSAAVDTVTDRLGYARPELPVRYNPITRYAQAQLIVTVTRPGHSEIVPGTVTIAQTIPLSSTRLRARPAYQQSWCPADRSACIVHNNSNIVIQVDSDPGAQVAVALSYPDGQAIPCPSSFANAAGVYRCQLPIVYQGKGHGANLLITAQISAGGYTQARTLRLLLTH